MKIKTVRFLKCLPLSRFVRALIVLLVLPALPVTATNAVIQLPSVIVVGQRPLATEGEVVWPAPAA